MGHPLLLKRVYSLCQQYVVLRNEVTKQVNVQLYHQVYSERPSPSFVLLVPPQQETILCILLYPDFWLEPEWHIASEATLAAAPSYGEPDVLRRALSRRQWFSTKGRGANGYQ